MSRDKIPTGLKFTNWTVLDELIIVSNKTNWKCRCDCGLEKFVRSADLKNGKSKRCFDCGLKEANKESRKCPLMQTTWQKIEKNARVRNLEFSITKEQAYDLFVKQNHRCVYTNLVLSFNSKTTIGDGTASLDRLDNEKGYTIDNVQWVHKKVNTIKMNLSEDDFLAICHLVAKNRKMPVNFKVSNIAPKINKFYNKRDNCRCGKLKLKTSVKCKKCYMHVTSS